MVAPEKSPRAARPRVEPRAAPFTELATISPLKTLSVWTSLVEAAVAELPESLEDEAVSEPVVTTEPSAG